MSLSKEYLEQLSHLHNTTKFGSGGTTLPKIVLPYLEKIQSLLDFGSGKGFFSNTIKEHYKDINLYTYDPVTSCIDLPTNVDMTYSSDVLEHIEPAYLKETLDMLFNITTKYQYHLIACHPAKKKLKDGRNAHLIIETPEWWKNKLSKYNWKIVFEKVKEKEKFIQGQQIHMVKYIVLLEKNE